MARPPTKNHPIQNMHLTDIEKEDVGWKQLQSKRFLLFIVVVVLVIAYSVYTSRSGRSQDSGRLSNLNIEVILQARELFQLNSTSAQATINAKQRQRFLNNLSEIARIEPTLQSTRRLALGQFLVGNPDWKKTLIHLRSLPLRMSARTIEEELGAWNAIMVSGASPADVRHILDVITSWKMGWFSHLARVNLYTNSHDNKLARQEVAAANLSTSAHHWIMQIRFLAGIIGVGLIIVFGRRLFASKATERPNIRLSWSAPIQDSNRNVGEGLVNLFILYLLLFMGSRIVFSWAIKELNFVSGSTTVAWAIIITNLVVSTIPIMLIGYHIKVRSPAGQSLLNMIPKDWAALGLDVVGGMVCFCVSVPIITFASIVSNILFSGAYSPINPAISQFANSNHAGLQILLFVMATIIAPIVEEMMFRGALMKGIIQRAGIVSGLFYSSLVFALLHPQLPHGLLPIFALGACFGAAAIVRRSLVSAIIAHALNNGLIFLMLVSLLHE